MLLSIVRERWQAQRARAELGALNVLPGDLRMPQPSFFDELQAGSFGLAGGTITFGAGSVFDAAAPSAEFSRALHGFGWLRDLAAARQDGADALARDLLIEWIARRRQHPQIGDEPRVRTRRLLSWLAHVNVALNAADLEAYDVIVAALAQERAAIADAWPRWPVGPQRIEALIGLIEAALACGQDATMRLRLETLLAKECADQILADGGHRARHPGVGLDLVLDLTALRQHYAAAAQPVPDFLATLIARMTAHLATLRHPDGALARLAGMGATPAGDLGAALAHTAAVQHSALLAASQFARLQVGDDVLLADAGSTGALSFEVSVAWVPLVVNRGGAAAGLVAADQSGLGWLEAGCDERAATGRVVSLEADGAAQTLDLEAIYARPAIVHRRHVRLDAEGLSGHERLLPRGSGPAVTAAAFALRFHLHPSIKAGRTADGSVRLTLPGGGIRRFVAEGRDVHLEPSVFRAHPSGPKSSLQLVIYGRAVRDDDVRWRFSA